MKVREKSHNEQVERIRSDRQRKWEEKEGSPGVQICWRDGKLIVRVDQHLYTKVYRAESRQEYP